MSSRRKTFVVWSTGIIALSAMTVGCGVKAWHSVSSRFGASDRVDFSRDIRPIFNQNCVSCHGGVRQKNDVSFIYRDEALGVG